MLALLHPLVHLPRGDQGCVLNQRYIVDKLRFWKGIGITEVSGLIRIQFPIQICLLRSDLGQRFWPLVWQLQVGAQNKSVFVVCWICNSSKQLLLESDNHPQRSNLKPKGAQ